MTGRLFSKQACECPRKLFNTWLCGCRLNDSGIARLLIFLTDPDVGSVTEEDSGFTDACEGLSVRLPDEL